MISRYVATLLLAGAVLAVACIDMSAPSGPASISELKLPSPSVVVNDTMRDSTGAVAPIRVIAFDAGNNPIPNVNTELFITDSAPLADFRPVALLVAGKKVGTVHVIGQVNQLQTPSVAIPVTNRPEKVVPRAVDTLRVPSSGDSTGDSRGKREITVTVTNAKDSASQGIIVHYAIDSAPASVDARFPAVYFAGSGKQTAVDTTDAAGSATQTLSASLVQFEPGALLPPGKVDTVFVTVTVKYAGNNVPGSPVSFAVPIRALSFTSTTLVPLRRPTKGDILAPVRSQRGNRWVRAVVPEIQRPAR